MKRLIYLALFLALPGCAANRGALTAEQKPQQAAPLSAPQSPAVPPAEMSRPPLAGMTDPNGGRSPSYSPDGKQIAFLSSTRHTPPDLWVMDADGSNARRLTTKGVESYIWSADGGSLLISVRRVGYKEVLRITPDGVEKRVPSLPPNCSIPVYSPDGNLLAFTAPAQGSENSRDLWVGTSSGDRAEPVTDKLSIRNFFWSPDSRSIFFEPGKTYGTGIWTLDLATMESKPLVSKYIGTPVFSRNSGLIAYPYPVNPGEFEVHTMKPDGTGVSIYRSPRLSGRSVAWDAAGKGVYYLAQDMKRKEGAEKPREPAEKSGAPHESAADKEFERVGVNSLWRLDLATGKEERISPENLHLTDYTFSATGGRMILEGVTEKSHAAELFQFEPASGELRQLVKSKPSAWMPVPSPDATKIALVTNEAFTETIKVASSTGEELASYPGVPLAADSRLYWLPRSEALVVFNSSGLLAFTENSPIEFTNFKDHRTFLFADASIQEDKILISSIPQYGESAGLYLLEAAGNKFVQTDLRYPAAPDMAAEHYMQPRWSLDGKKIAFSDGIDIWTMSAEGKGRTWITGHAEENNKDKEKYAVANYPVWSSKGDKICYTVTAFHDKDIFRQLWLINADGSGARMLFSEQMGSQFQVFLPEFTNQPFFDYNDEHIILTAVDNGIPNIYSVEVKGGKVSRLTETGGIYPALLPEEGVIVYVSLEGNMERTFLMNSDGSEKRPFVVKAKPGAPEGKTAVPPAASEPGKNAAKPAETAKEKAGPAEPVKKKAQVKKKRRSNKKAPIADAVKQ